MRGEFSREMMKILMDLNEDFFSSKEGIYNFEAFSKTQILIRLRNTALELKTCIAVKSLF